MVSEIFKATWALKVVNWSVLAEQWYRCKQLI